MNDVSQRIIKAHLATHPTVFDKLSHLKASYCEVVNQECNKKMKIKFIFGNYKVECIQDMWFRQSQENPKVFDRFVGYNSDEFDNMWDIFFFSGDKKKSLERNPNIEKDVLRLLFCFIHDVSIALSGQDPFETNFDILLIPVQNCYSKYLQL